MTLASILTLLIGAGCAAAFIVLIQLLFPRRAPWALVGAALVSGIAVTFLLTLILKHTVEPGIDALQQLSSLWDALRFAALRAALPEEATKALATLLALLPFWRRVTPAQVFQAALVVAVGFAFVENRGYAAAFEGFGILIAFGRGLLATLIHATVAMVFGGFLMRFAAGGWRSWHLVLLGYLAASLCHALHDAGLMLPTAEFLRSGTVAPETVLAAAPVVVFGFGLLLVWGLWSLRSATRRAAAVDPLTLEPRHQAIVRNWRRAANILLVLGAIGMAGSIAWGVAVEVESGTAEALQQGLFVAIGICGALFAILISWVLRQKR